MPTVNDYMAHEPIVLLPDMGVHAARRLLVQNEISGAPVVDEGGRLVGILTERDIIGGYFRASYHQDQGDCVADCMTAEIETIESETDVSEAAELFLKSRYRRFPVLVENRLVGLLSRRDILRAIEDLWQVEGRWYRDL